MVPDSSSSSGRAAARSPIIYALAGAGGAALLVGAAAYAFWPAAPGAGPAGGPPGGGFAFGPSPVEVVAAMQTIAAEPVSIVGEVAPARAAIVAGEVEGRVAQLLVDEGDSVAAGAVLVRLDTTTAELDLAAAHAQRAEAAARLTRFESEARRMSELRESGAISEREYEDAQADRDAQSQMVTRIDAETARLGELIRRAEIVAPFAGQVAAVHAELGEWNDRGGAAITLVDLSTVEVTVNAPERYVAQVEQARLAGIEVPVVFDAIPGPHSGAVQAVLPQANSLARTFPVVVAVPNPDGLIRSGMSARVLAQIGEPVPMTLVPKDALVLRSGRTFVFRVVAAAAPPDTADAAAGEAQGSPAAADAPAGEAQGPPPSGVEELEVTLGSAYGEWQVVLGDVAAGDRVVVRGNEGLRPGMPVMVTGVADIPAPPLPNADVPLGERAGSGGRQ